MYCKQLMKCQDQIDLNLTKVSFVFTASKDDEVSPLQLHLLNQSSRKVKDTVSKLATEHKELHGGISKIGKAIDRVSNEEHLHIC